MKYLKQYQDRSGETIDIRMTNEGQTYVRTADAGLALRIPHHWKPEPAVNVHAADIEATLLDWFRAFGFDERAIETLRTFAPGHYAGVPFPKAGWDELFLIARYLSLWLLWDDEDVETQGRGFRLQASQVLEPHANAPTNLFDRAWWSLFRELAETRTPEWIEMLLETMHVWSTAALQEARISKARREGHVRVTFAAAMQSRIATIGMYASAYLTEYAQHVELPKEFHDHATVHQIKMLAGKIVGLGNDLSSLGKDMASNYVNVILVLKDELVISLREAVRVVVHLHEEALLEFDRLAASLPSFGHRVDAAIQVWLGDLRQNCVGFTMWEARAPRYAAFKVFVDGAVVEPHIVLQAPAFVHVSTYPRGDSNDLQAASATCLSPAPAG